MYFRSLIRLCNKDNDKIIGKMMKRTYWTPDFQEEKSSSQFKSEVKNCNFESKAMLNLDTKLDIVEKKLDILIAFNKKQEK